MVPGDSIRAGHNSRKPIEILRKDWQAMINVLGNDHTLSLGHGGLALLIELMTANRVDGWWLNLYGLSQMQLRGTIIKVSELLRFVDLACGHY